MQFDSLDFALFLPVVFLLYWFVFQRNLKAQNFFIVIASYLFYGWWDWRFLSLILFSTVLDYSIGVFLEKLVDPLKRKRLLYVSLAINLGFLGVFKYFNFFLESFVDGFALFGYHPTVSSLEIILPVGISFYTFQSLSYTIDIYKRKLTATKDFVAFTAFVCFFPQLVAGPIERAANLLPQFYTPRRFDYHQAVDGLRQILWGLFKKVVIADNCAEYANLIFNNSADESGSTLFLGAVFFTFQIYGDFSGYSDIAIGTSRLFGFHLMRNFSFPYFSRDIAEFWRRWHISLSTWFRDYLYIPLGGSKGGKWMKVRNTFIIFLVSGFWHGANWTFVAWGALNALYFLPLLLLDRNRSNLDTVAQGRLFPDARELFSMLLTFGMTVLAWIFFRADSLKQAFSIIGEILSPSSFSIPQFDGRQGAAFVLLGVAIFMTIEWLGRERSFAIHQIGLNWSKPLRWGFYTALALAVFLFSGKEQQFIYFQF